MIVPSTESKPDDLAPAQVLDLLTAELASLTPQLRKAATYVLENPNDIGVCSVREIAEAAEVKPNTLVRMARTVGFEGYEDFRRPFREEIRQGRDSFPDRARWLQSLAKGGRLRELNASMASVAIANIERLYLDSDSEDLKAAADAIVQARATYVLGVGIANAFARNFAYLAGMAVENVTDIPRDGALPVDGLLQADQRDVLVAMTFKPFRREAVEAVEVAVRGVGQDRAGRTVGNADHRDALAHRFVIPTETPQFFTSTVALAAFLETLMAFVVADADKAAIANIERFHERRQALGVYWNEEDSRR